METLADRVRARLEFDVAAIQDQVVLMGYNYDNPLEHKAFEYGAQNEHARNAKLFDALVQAVEKLEEIVNEQEESSHERSENFLWAAQSAIKAIEAALGKV